MTAGGDVTAESGPARTRLSWRRTTLSATVVAILAIRLAVDRDAPLAVTAAAALWLAVLWVSHRREVAALAFMITGYAVLGALLVLAGGGA